MAYFKPVGVEQWEIVHDDGSPTSGRVYNLIASYERLQTPYWGDLTFIFKNYAKKDNAKLAQDMQYAYIHNTEFTSPRKAHAKIETNYDIIIKWGADIYIYNGTNKAFGTALYELLNWQSDDLAEQAQKLEKQYFSEKDLKDALGEDGQKQLDAVTIDPGKNFMEGKPTNVMTDTTGELNAPTENGEDATYYQDYVEKLKAEEAKDPTVIDDHGEDESYQNYLNYINSDNSNDTQTNNQENNNEEKTITSLTNKKTDTTLGTNIGKSVANFGVGAASAAISGGKGELANYGVSMMSSTISKNVSKGVTSILKDNTAKNLINASATAFGAYKFGEQLVLNGPEILITLSQKLITKATTTITKESTKLITDYVNKHIKATMKWPSNVQSYAMQYFNSYKMSVGDIMKKLNESSEDRAEKHAEESKKKKMSKFIDKMKTQMNDVKGKIDKYTKEGTSYIQMVTSYIQNGPDWVTEQLDKQIGNLVGKVKTEIDKQWVKDEELYNKTAKATGDEIGKKMVEKYNKNLQKAQDKQMKQMKKMKAKALAQTKAALGAAKCQIAALLGIYIP